MGSKNSYRSFTEGKFRYEMLQIVEKKLVDLKQKYKYTFWNITDEWREKGNETWELVYVMKTDNPAVDLIIFTSIYEKTRESRDKNEDRVRLVMRWKIQKKYMFGHLKRHNRTENLFKNLGNSIVEAQRRAISRLDYCQFEDDVQKLERVSLETDI
ncbi:hypothetical protein BSK52_00355 [Paenibacillus odorifer]|uniref:Uncharacterized protein n=2 Tax=Paenibacillus odorifer TaxID=189426 RepID=A0A1R0Y9K0_9BACL|nr:hypothetical protein BSK52_00355 [Paenibacillus odorifer]